MLGRCTTGPCAAKAFCAPLAPHHSDRDEKEAASALPFTRRLCRCGRCQSLGRRQRRLPKTLCHLIRQSAGPCEPREREVETRFLQFFVSEPSIEPLAGDVAHLVVQDRPFRALSLEAESDEIDRHLGDPLLWQLRPLPDATWRIIRTLERSNKGFRPPSCPQV